MATFLSENSYKNQTALKKGLILNKWYKLTKAVKGKKQCVKAVNKDLCEQLP